ncbi:MAG: UDP-4-amino-4,6-dideoxy-N-acetyl-beta-L-altrosamine transaminase [Lachnospiraceae bacterium]|nr:UDP-4-amino-4,6-dideoxy-N-acetyl-beta-L-altrosamine transaminase [Lachnospiraceae bacterium]MCI7040791.1 UDP-4-amino-4,6-dideoxy-N-acetyl-beta-L-altrosamine transaminase [Lachnospiraceae bacterium]MCI7190720.1 UDP-4-amino-4,6-dideoxy-N-acetyl-beta-L-altrosamine transaminase [Lachnospiraceae bacterium]MDD7629052.1 UDP-4-amino-4,6-dideoxy-N-acetyl-beta-L-altrosamine transaminase [Lachnospiraceae bacterium]MDY4117726.1 UDP-4-amino-4,6-dideoxy-N-acetyl-beta-L-altrosamine transaminase [Lachnospir
MDKPAICGGKPIRGTKIFYGHQYIDDADIQAVVEVLKSDYLTCGPKIEELEKKLCAVTGAKYAVVCSNGTAALHMACQAAGIGAGDEMITTPITFAASANCALYCGAKPVFADINEETYNIDPAHVESLTTEKTKAVVAVDYTGQSVELDRLLAHCRKHNLVLIEDGAHVIGTSYNGKKNGSIADMTTLSFHPVKTVTGGEGGAVLTNSEEYYQKLLLYRSHGITKNPAKMEHEPDGPWYYEQVALGMNYRMTDMQAALIISQLDKLPLFMKRRKEIVKAYDEAFSKLPQLFVQKEIPQSDTTRHLYILRIIPEKLKIDRKQFFEALAAENICCQVHYIPVYYFPYYEKLGYQKGLCPKAEKLYEEEISLPLYYAMTDQDVDDVIQAVTKIVEYFKR